MIGRLLWVLGVAAFVVVFVFAMIDAGQKETECEARGGVMVYSSPIANGVPVGKCVAGVP